MSKYLLEGLDHDDLVREAHAIAQRVKQKGERSLEMEAFIAGFSGRVIASNHPDMDSVIEIALREFRELPKLTIKDKECFNFIWPGQI